MRKQLLFATSAAIVLALPAFAQDAAGSSNETAASQNRSASDVTCREITALDTATVPGVLYFISGFRQGEQSGGAMPSSGASASTGMDADQSASASGMTATGSSDAASGSADSVASGTAQTADSGSATSGTAQSADAGSATGANTEMGASAGQDTTGATSGSSDSAGSGSAMSGTGAQIASIQGYFDIPIEQTIVACRSEPDSRAADVIDRNRGTGGSAGSSGNTGTAQ